MIHYALYPPEGNFTGVIPKPSVTALSGETYKYAGGGRKSRKQKRITKSKKPRRNRTNKKRI
jgi:hypothetical protein